MRPVDAPKTARATAGRAMNHFGTEDVGMQTMERRADSGTRSRTAGPGVGDPEVDDLDLVERVREGDATAFGVIFERHRSAVRAVAARHCDTRADADDVTVTCFVRTFCSIRRGHGPTTSLRSYLIATTVRVAGDRQRGRRFREVPLEEAAEPAGTTDPGFDLGFFDSADGALALAFGQLPPRWQHVLWETYVVGRPAREIAMSMGLRANTAAAIVYRARIGLREAYLAAVDADEQTLRRD